MNTITIIYILVCFSIIVFVLLCSSIMFQYMDSYVQSKTALSKCGEELYEYDTLRYKFLLGIDRQYLVSNIIHFFCLLIVVVLLVFSVPYVINFIDDELDNIDWDFSTLLLTLISFIGIVFYAIAYAETEKNENLKTNIQKVSYSTTLVLCFLILVYLFTSKEFVFTTSFEDITPVWIYVLILNIIVGCYIFLFNHVLINQIYNSSNPIQKIKELFTYIIHYKDDYDDNESKQRLVFTFTIIILLLGLSLIFLFISRYLKFITIPTSFHDVVFQLCILLIIAVFMGLYAFIIFDIMFKNVFNSNKNYCEILQNLQQEFSGIVSEKQLFRFDDINELSTKLSSITEDNCNLVCNLNLDAKPTHDDYKSNDINSKLDKYKLQLTNNLIFKYKIVSLIQREYIETVVDNRLDKLKDYLNSNKNLNEAQFYKILKKHIDNEDNQHSIYFYLTIYISTESDFNTHNNSSRVLFRDPKKSNRNLYREIIKRYNLLNNKNIDPESTEFKNVQIFNKDNIICNIDIIDDNTLYNPVIDIDNEEVKQSISMNEFKDNYDIRLLPISYISLYDGNIDKALQSIGMQSSSKDIYDIKKNMFNEYARIKPEVEDNIYWFAYMAILIVLSFLVLIYIILHYILKLGVFGKKYYNYMTALAILIILISSIISFIMYKRNF